MVGWRSCSKISGSPFPARSLFFVRVSLAGFKTHISTSTVVGCAYGYWGVVDQGMSMESALLAGGLCSVSGMLPDLDSDSGVPLRETTMFLSAVVPMLMIDRWRDMGLTHEAMALAAMIVYVAIRFVAVEGFRKFTVHRGMWHSIPAALVAGLIAYMLMPCASEAVRVYKSCAVLAGFMTHLILDEIWALDFSRGSMRVKKSFGTALKFFGSSPVANIFVWGQLGLFVYLAWGDHEILDRLRQRVRMDAGLYATPSEDELNPDYTNPSLFAPWESREPPQWQPRVDSPSESPSRFGWPSQAQPAQPAAVQPNAVQPGMGQQVARPNGPTALPRR
ncbi:MAG: metal-dependent hydrolase [Rhodopirellula sp. JB055]|uniref:metal-dependent hydrolase n=1 Tax=Rhodopirellula sp. JB055 TaxID=3342846 RepID=UPI00370A0E98